MPLSRSNGTSPQTALKSRWNGTAWSSVIESRYDGTAWQPVNSRTTGPMPTLRNNGVTGKGALAGATLTPTATAGDTLLLFVYTPTGSITFTTPGYTPISSDTAGPSYVVGTRTATGSDAVTITPSATDNWTAILVPIQNVGSVVVGTKVSVGSGTTITLPALTTDSGNQLLLDVVALNNGADTLTFDAATTLVAFIAGIAQTMGMASKSVPTMGVVAARTDTISPTNSKISGWPILVKPT